MSVRFPLRETLFFLSLGALAAPAAAQPWEMVPGESRLTFTATAQGQALQGRFESFTADIDFDPAAPGEAEIVITIPLETATMGASDVDREVKGQTWFHIEEYPKATFTVTDLAPTGGDGYDLAADLTLRGTTVPVTFPVTIAVDGDTATAAGEVVLDRSNYGVGQGQFTSPDTVAFEVTVAFTIVAKAGGGN